MRWLSSVLSFSLILLLKGYHFFLSPLLHVLVGFGAGCRFEPSCSQYAVEALRTQGVRRGLKMSFRRICKCHPWGGGGYDPLPQHPQNINSESHGS